MGNRAGMYGFIESVRDRPLLALSVYHRMGDMLAIMDYLHHLVSEYRFWLRHYSVGLADTVLYAAAGENNTAACSRLRICQEGKYKNRCIFERGKRRKNPSPPQWAKGAKKLICCYAAGRIGW